MCESIYTIKKITSIYIFFDKTENINSPYNGFYLETRLGKSYKQKISEINLCLANQWRKLSRCLHLFLCNEKLSGNK